MESHVKRNIVCAFLSVIVLVVFVILICSYNARTSAETSQLESATAEAKPYEDELTELKRSITKAADELSDTSETARFIVGYIISSEEDITYAEEQAAEYGFEPVIILDCYDSLSDLLNLSVAASEAGHEIMLTASAFTSAANDNAISLLYYMDRNGIEYSQVFLLRSDYYSDSSIEMLISDGFVGYTVYNTSPTSGVTEDGYVTFDYSYLTTDSSSYTRFSSSYSNLASMVIAVDMDSIRTGTLTESFVLTLLSTISSYSENDNCEFSSVSDVVECLLEENQSMEERTAEYEAYVAECEQRIEELEEIIAEIYAQLD